MTPSVDNFTIVADFALCKYDFIQEESSFWTDTSDERMTKDNLVFFEIVKLPHNVKSYNYNGFELSVGDRVISIAIGDDLKFPNDPNSYKLLEMKYLTAKRC